MPQLMIALPSPGFGTVLRQGLIVHPQIADALAARGAGDEQRGFRQTVGGHETVFE